MRPIQRYQIYTSLLVALVLQLLPWTGIGVLIRPDFLFLVVIYWLLRAPHLCNIGTAWGVGLIMDVATGGLFGQTALAYAISAFFAVMYQRRLALFDSLQQAAYVFALLLLTQSSLFVMKLFAGGNSPGWIFYAPCVTSILIWQAMMLFTRAGVEAQTKQ